MIPDDLRSPAAAYDGGGLADVLPSVCAALGVPDVVGRLPVPECRRAVVVLVDGLGDVLLRRRGGHAPFLRSLLATGTTLLSGFPSTTATSMGTFGTGLPPGAHGMLGYMVMIPGADRLLNELSWEDGPDPYLWQPRPTLFGEAEAAGVRVTRTGPGYFDGSGLTNAALRGGSFVAATTLADRVDATLSALGRDPRSLAYLYWGEVDKIGHVRGPDSWQWGAELEAVDGELRRLADSVPDDTAIVVTADHGMVTSPLDERIDLAHDAELAAGVRHVGARPARCSSTASRAPPTTSSPPGRRDSGRTPGSSHARRPTRSSAGSTPRCSSGSATSSSPCAAPRPSWTPAPNATNCAASSACTAH
ncbi:alkaline phosphatase family protein [Mobilicoccus caccae]|uniref:Type I phosphodiesterase / nucleotide pyrophosphatase n=1 Tax=Mobilicoccus caccae TaxID=1859295 RepID=A0ABQ6IRU1_9MICO|nr:hypothetical protein GCM10025883_18110 [Mobilicoccus caccae]